ncbi:MAG: prolipoprotein diacylglyceryl transferase [Tissierellia bacterium]|nr:prolipoprotein diacylglyceryl transferase [Tissierellia bacterium]
MDPTAFTLFGIDIQWYGILIATGAFLAIVLGIKQTKTTVGITEDDFIDSVLWILPIAVVCARLYYVVFFDFAYYMANPMQILNFREGGLAIYGGVIGGIIVGWIFCKRRKINFFTLFDIAAPGLALAQGIGRWGNFINQEAHGGPTDLPWGIMVNGIKVHPTFLYESIVDIGLFFFLYFYLRKHKKYEGQMAATYMVVYSLARFFIEGLRTDSLMLGSFRVSQLVSIGGIIIGLIVGYMNRKNLVKK